MEEIVRCGERIPWKLWGIEQTAQCFLETGHEGLHAIWAKDMADAKKELLSHPVYTTVQSVRVVGNTSEPIVSDTCPWGMPYWLDGSKVAKCELPKNHYGNHKTNIGGHEEYWQI